MSEEKKSFTVNDRRHFTAEGEAREGAQDAPATPPPAEDPSPGPSTATAPSGAGPAPPAVTFAGFVVSLAAQGASILAEAPEGETAEEQLARLADARQIVSILEMLKDKSEGRRTPDEEQVLEGILYELRMAYLHAARGPVQA